MIVPAARNTKEVRPVVHVLAEKAEGQAVAAAHSLPDVRCFSRIEARGGACYSLNRFGPLCEEGTSAHSSLSFYIVTFMGFF